MGDCIIMMFLAKQPVKAEQNISVLKIKCLQIYLEAASLCGPLNWHDFHIRHPWETFHVYEYEPVGLPRTNKTRKADVEIVV